LERRTVRRRVKGLKSPVENDEVIVVYAQSIRYVREEVNLAFHLGTRQAMTQSMWTEKSVGCFGSLRTGTSGSVASKGRCGVKSRSLSVREERSIPWSQLVIVTAGGWFRTEFGRLMRFLKSVLISLFSRGLRLGARSTAPLGGWSSSIPGLGFIFLVKMKMLLPCSRN
jgi:hypothetical protein